MKNFKIIMILSALIILALVFTGCGNKTALTADGFKSTMESKGFTVKDATGQFGKGIVDKVYIALNKNYQIEFYSVPSEEQAINAFNQNKANFEKLKSSANVNTDVSLGNSSKYTLNSGGKYNVVSRISNTFIYLSVDSANKSEVDTILKDLGY